MEFAATLLAPRGVPLMVAYSSQPLNMGVITSPEFLSPLDASFLLPGEGDFAVPGDKQQVAMIIETLLNAKVQHLFALGELFGPRCFEAMRKKFLTGLPISGGFARQKTAAAQAQGGGAVELLKARLHWRDSTEEIIWVRETGAPLVVWAALAGDDKAMAELLALPGGAGRQDVNVSLRVPLAALNLTEGMTPLHRK